jgi:hypothetical protein
LPEFNPDHVLSTLIHAGSKQGKTTLASTSPPPHLALDAEGGWKFIDEAGYKTGKKLRRIRWNPATEPIPQHDGTWDLCSVTVRNWATMTLVYQHLTQRPHQFRSITWDSITEVQRTCRDALKGTEAMQLQDWGVLLIQMDDMIRKFRNLTLDPSNTVQVVNFIAETKMRDGKWRPYMQGQITDALPYMVDVCGYLTTQWGMDDAGQPTVRQPVLNISPSDYWEAGERVQGRLPNSILLPNITNILNSVYPNAVTN